ncbi:MAG: DUF1559 domain-containing protein [Planctomycetota bacterium]
MLNRRRGITLIDLVAGSFCCAVISAIALPAISLSRSDAELVRCSDNLRQLSLGVHNYHDVNRRLPAGPLCAIETPTIEQWNVETNGHYWKVQQNSSTLLLISPFLEIREYDLLDPLMMNFRQSLMDHCDSDGTPIYTDYLEVTGVDDVLLARQQQLYCPSDQLFDVVPEKVIIASQPLADPAGPEGANIHEEDMGLKFHPDVSAFNEIGLTNYYVNGGVSAGQASENASGERPAFRGPCWGRRKQLLERIFDGTSNTILYGETLGEIADGNRGAVPSWMFGGQGRMRGDIPWGEWAHPENEQRKILGDAAWAGPYGFASLHVTGVNFVMTDASVRNFPRDIDVEVPYAMAGSNDGLVVDISEYDNLAPIRDRERVETQDANIERIREAGGAAFIDAVDNDPLLNQREKNAILQRYLRIARERMSEERMNEGG